MKFQDFFYFYQQYLLKFFNNFLKDLETISPAILQECLYEIVLPEIHQRIFIIKTLRIHLRILARSSSTISSVSFYGFLRSFYQLFHKENQKLLRKFLLKFPYKLFSRFFKDYRRYRRGVITNCFIIFPDNIQKFLPNISLAIASGIFLIILYAQLYFPWHFCRSFYQTSQHLVQELCKDSPAGISSKFF